MRITLIHNPGAGKQNAGDRKALVALLEGAGYDVRYQSSKDDAWKKALKKDAELIVVAGGDGTVAKVARRMVGRGVPIAPLPAGTANNISRSLGLAGRTFEDIVRGWRHPRRAKLDIGVAEGPWGERYFLEGVGIGLFASLLSSGSKRATFASPAAKIDHGLARLERLAKKGKPAEIKARLDGKDISGAYLLLEAINLPFVGPSLYLSPDSKPGDGQLDVVLVTDAERRRLLECLAAWRENKERLAVLPSHKGTHLVVEWTGFDLHIDDKLWPKPGKKPKPPARIEARIEAHAVEFFLPPLRRSRLSS